MIQIRKNTFTFISLICILTFFCLPSLTSCKKDKLLTQGGDLAFSTDTLTFDTVFTSVGSVTRSFKLYNRNNKRIKLDRIWLTGGANSAFRMNIDGEATRDIANVELAPDDSIYIFVALTIDPTTGLNPFLINDQVNFSLNGNSSAVVLEAFGQDAHYLSDSIIGSSQTWINDKPYVIVHSALVDSTVMLTIQKGCRIYMHQDSKLFVKGTLNVYGTKQDSVIFQGDRLDRDYFGYKDYPGEWRGIHFLGASEKSHINYAIIKNAGFSDAALLVQPPKFFDANNPTVELNNTIIENSLGYGILAFNAHIRANNCLVHSCGAQNLAILEGGTYSFNYCTFSTYGSLLINHSQEPTAAILNYRDLSLTQDTGANLNAYFTNCIIYGPLEDEVVFGKRSKWDYNVTLSNCILKRTAVLNDVTTNNVLLNSDPLFNDYNKWDFHPKANSPVKLAGINIPSIIDDLDGNSRGVLPSIGCYEVP